MRELEIVQWLRREFGAFLRLSPWIVVALLVAAALWRTDLTATSGLFQSPPTETPTAIPVTPTPTQAATATPTTVVTATTVSPEPPTPQASPSTAPTTETVTPVESPTAASTETTATPTQALPSATPSLTSTPSEDSETEDSQRYAEEDSGLQFEWGELFDAVALGASYAWLCCGAVTVLSVPVLFVILTVASKRRQQAQDRQQEQDDQQGEDDQQGQDD